MHRYTVKNDKRVADKNAVRAGTATEVQHNRVSATVASNFCVLFHSCDRDSSGTCHQNVHPRLQLHDGNAARATGVRPQRVCCGPGTVQAGSGVPRAHEPRRDRAHAGKNRCQIGGDRQRGLEACSAQQRGVCCLPRGTHSNCAGHPAAQHGNLCFIYFSS